MTETPQRRTTDLLGGTERLAVLESTMMDIRTALRDHILDESNLIQGTRDDIQSTRGDIAVIRAQGETTVAMIKDSHKMVIIAIDKLVDQGTKIHVLEIKQEDSATRDKRTEDRLDRVEQDHAVTKEQVKRILLGFGFLGSVTLVVIGWLLQYHKII
jgi:hypothetical protein